LPKSSQEFLLRLATNVDELSHSLAVKTHLAADIGLSSTQPMSSYPTITTDQKYFSYTFMSAITFDRCLWSIGCTGTVPAQQWLHPLSSRPPSRVTDYPSLEDCVRNFLVAYGSRGSPILDDNVEPLVGLSANLSVKTVAHQNSAELSRVMGHMYFLASGFIALSVVSWLTAVSDDCVTSITGKQERASFSIG
jgi:hypothetical protein